MLDLQPGRAHAARYKASPFLVAWPSVAHKTRKAPGAANSGRLDISTMKKLLGPAEPVKVIGAPSAVSGVEEAAPFIERWLAMQRGNLLRQLASCESPIETIFALAMLIARDKDGVLLRLIEPGPRGAHADEAHGHHLAYGRAGSFFAQRVVDLGRRAARVDFVLVTDKLRVAIELDGHKFHASKAKLSADAARDIDLTERGWTPVRFTGSDIWRDADGCAARVLDLAGFKVERGEAMRPARSAPKATPSVVSTDEKLMADKAGAEAVLKALEGVTPPARKRDR